MDLHTVSDEVVSKIKKLLALATSGNEAEATAALLKAKEFAERHSVDLAAINPFDENQEEIKFGRVDIDLGRRLPICQKFTNWIIQKHFNVVVIRSGGRSEGRNIIFIGTTHDLQIAQYVQSYLNHEFMRLWYAYRAKSNAPLSDRASYHYGLYQGLDAKLSDNKVKFTQTRVEEIQVEKGQEFAQAVVNKHALVKINTKKMLDAEVDKQFPELRHRTTRVNAHNHNAISQGMQDGRNINLNRGIGAGSGTLIKS